MADSLNAANFHFVQALRDVQASLRMWRSLTMVYRRRVFVLTHKIEERNSMGLEAVSDPDEISIISVGFTSTCECECEGKGRR